MADLNEIVQYIKIGNIKYSIDAITLGGKESDAYQENMLVTAINSSSDDSHYPSAKCIYDIIGNINTILDNINGEVI